MIARSQVTVASKRHNGHGHFWVTLKDGDRKVGIVWHSKRPGFDDWGWRPIGFNEKQRMGSKSKNDAVTRLLAYWSGK